MDCLGQITRIPDAWQSEALKYLKSGCDVVLDAPTGAGKTYVFEMFVERGFSGRVVYSVPTRALANDKYWEWKSRGWRVGISTGDYCVDTDAPIVVATLETQKNNFFNNRTPDLLVIDEYQLLSDSIRGFNYELAVALAPKHTQLLLMSGSVENISDVQKWLIRIGRDCKVVSDSVRAVPLEEIISTALPEGNLKGIYGMWPRLVKKIIDADMSPVLIFAPHRAEAEAIARRLASELPCADFLSLPKQIASSAGRELSNMMRKRIAFHHSGLSAYQRSAVVEKYARNGELTAVVATTGLGAGVNFSMRSCIVVSREYETITGTRALRADELLQMYGRAGRRGKDKVGYAISLPSKPRLSDARKGILKRVQAVDSSASIRIIAQAVDDGKNPVFELEKFYSRLFTTEKIDIGWRDIPKLSSSVRSQVQRLTKSVKIEILNSKNVWERRRVKTPTQLEEVLFFDNGWCNFLSSAKAVASLHLGRVCKVGNSFGVLVDIAHIDEQGEIYFTKNAKKIVNRVCETDKRYRCYFRDKLTLKNIKRNFGKFLNIALAGAQIEAFEQSQNFIRARINLSEARVLAYVDTYSNKLYQPPEREREVVDENNFEKLSGFAENTVQKGSIVSDWFKFGLIGGDFKPTIRGRIFSFFNGGEGYAVVAAIEDESYDIEDLVFDLANLRAGGRFQLSQNKSGSSSRLADCCRLLFLSANVKGALKSGIPITYGAGASEIIREIHFGAQMSRFESDLILRGDVERAYLEWKSMLRHISSLPELDNARWLKLQEKCRQIRD